ncbi:MAG: DNA translocase FtsK [Chloroflexota bacterium]|nr:MAG: DNA translocase FtsK [Chloroflexota bacterium]
MQRLTSYLRRHVQSTILVPVAILLLVLGIIYVPRLVAWIAGLIARGIAALVEGAILPTALAVRHTFGLGTFLLLLVAVVIFALLVLERRYSYHVNLKWHQWASLVTLVPLAFGLLAFLPSSGKAPIAGSPEPMGSGGALGALIVGSTDVWGIGRLVLLVLLAASLYSPRRARAIALYTARMLLRLVSRLWHWFIQVVLAFGTGDTAESKARSAVESDLTVVEEPVREPTRTPSRANSRAKTAVVPQDKSDPLPARRVKGTAWKLPPMDLLENVTSEGRNLDNGQRVKLIEDKLREYGVDARVIEVNQGPAVTQFGIEPGWDVKWRTVKERDEEGRLKYEKDGRPRLRLEEISRTRVKVNKITGLSNDLALALAVPSVRIEAPVPGKALVGLEIPNISTAVVGLRHIVESFPFQKLTTKTKLGLALGQGVQGQPVVADLSKMPHLLIAGATGSGKSVFINSIVASLLMQSVPDEVRFIMVDPKRVELVPYNGIPHLLAPVVVDAEKVTGVLKWVVREMEDRYKKFASNGVRNIEGYNKRMAADGKALPYWVVIIDELADLMMVAADEVERMLCRLAQLARATGIHLVVATQRPSVDVVTGLIKANFPTRVSFAVTSQIDSRTILDTGGAEKLLGHGDMLYMAADASKPVRLQGTLVTDTEIERLVGYWVSATPPVGWTAEQTPDFEALQEEDRRDPLLAEAKRLADQHSRVSVSLLQRRLRVGYVRASRLMELLREDGLVDGDDDESERDGYYEDDDI